MSVQNVMLDGVREHDVIMVGGRDSVLDRVLLDSILAGLMVEDASSVGASYEDKKILS